MYVFWAMMSFQIASLRGESWGVVPQELAIYEDLSAAENLSYWGAAYGLSGKALTARVKETLSNIGLLDRSREPTKKFSGGMKRRLNFGCGIVHQPKVLLLDEPTVGVDPQSREKLLDLVREQVKLGTCVLYTTHYMEEAEALCDELAIIDHGKIIASGTLESLRGMMGEQDVIRLSGRFEVESIASQLASMDQLEILLSTDQELHLATPNATKHLSQIFEVLNELEVEIRETTLTQPNLESLFIKLTGSAFARLTMKFLAASIKKRLDSPKARTRGYFCSGSACHCLWGFLLQQYWVARAAYSPKHTC